MAQNDSPFRAPAAAAIAGGALIVALATAAMLRRIEPFATWYYLFAWYGTLLALDGVVAWTADARRFLLLGRWRHAATLLAWSAVAWLFFELINLRLRNWYYVYVPDVRALRWPATLASFATVFPAVFLSEAALRGLGVARRVRWPRLRLTPGRLRAVSVAGAVMFVLPLLWPTYFFPLVWGGVLLLLEPLNHRRDPRRSLLGDLERGRPGRILRLLLGGAFIGLLWELYNVEARSKWIYTVPGLDELKLFEMPVLGFLGFPPFALECFAIWQALVLGGVVEPRGAGSRAPRVGAALSAAVFALSMLYAVDRWTISSYTPRLGGIPGAPAARLRAAGYDVFSLARARPAAVAEAAGADAVEATGWVETARLAALRGIGTTNARRLRRAGVGSVAELAAADPDALARRLRAVGARPVVDARVRVWVCAARRAVDPI